jgi:hypothetical protein
LFNYELPRRPEYEPSPDFVPRDLLAPAAIAVKTKAGPLIHQQKVGVEVTTENEII